jgi:hypothetical protein
VLTSGAGDCELLLLPFFLDETPGVSAGGGSEEEIVEPIL